VLAPPPNATGRHYAAYIPWLWHYPGVSWETHGRDASPYVPFRPSRRGYLHQPAPHYDLCRPIAYFRPSMVAIGPQANTIWSIFEYIGPNYRQKTRISQLHSISAAKCLVNAQMKRRMPSQRSPSTATAQGWASGAPRLTALRISRRMDTKQLRPLPARRECRQQAPLH